MRTALRSLLLLWITILTSNHLHAQWARTTGPSGRGGVVHAVCVEDSTLFAATDAGLYASPDLGRSWSDVTPKQLPWGGSGAATSVTTSGQYVYAAFDAMGICLSSDRGKTWAEVDLTAPRVMELASSGGWIVTGSLYASSFPQQSTDNGASWASMSIGYCLSCSLRDSIGLAVSPDGRISRSTNRGVSWSQVYKDSLARPFFSVTFYGPHAYAGAEQYLFASRDTGAGWQLAGTLPCRTINALAVCPQGPQVGTLFAATDSGVFCSSDGGGAWVAKNTGLRSLAALALAFRTDGTAGDPVLFAGTGAGVYRSMDYGNTWTAVGTPAGMWHLAAADSTVFAASSFQSYDGPSKYQLVAGRGYCEVFRSTDYGSTWAEADSGLIDAGDFYLTSIAATAERATGFNVYAGVFRSQRMNNGAVFASNDRGGSWRKVYADTLTYAPVTGLAATPEVVLAGMGELGVARSTDRGVTWQSPDTGAFAGGFVNSFSFDGSVVYGGGGYVKRGFRLQPFCWNEVSRSKDYGASWERVDSGFTQKVTIGQMYDTVSILTSIYASGTHLLVGTRAYWLGLTNYPMGGGIYHVQNNGSVWVVTDSAMMGKQVFSFVGYGRDIFAAVDSTVFRSSDHGVSWVEIGDGFPRAQVQALQLFNGYIFASTRDGIWKRPLTEVVSSVSDEVRSLPLQISLEQNYPNPFNPLTTIRYSLPHRSHVTLTVFNTLGQKVADLVNGDIDAGYHEIRFNASNLASGVYFYRLQAGAFVQTRSMCTVR